jgi:soluble lytic murein transglycosylase-like protein
MFLALTAEPLEASRASKRVPDDLVVTSTGDDPVTDQFLQRYRPLRENSARRHALAAEIATAAEQHGLDPDLLFALVAVESRFNSGAVSRRGARGLGQLMYPTARAVAPTLVRRPMDLYNVRRNLAITARHLHELLMDRHGDLQAALAAYHLGRHGGRMARGEDVRYVGLICTHYASLKVKRGYEAMAATSAENAEGTES